MSSQYTQTADTAQRRLPILSQSFQNIATQLDGLTKDDRDELEEDSGSVYDFPDSDGEDEPAPQLKSTHVQRTPAAASYWNVTSGTGNQIILGSVESLLP
jgi:hypothetical protein